MAETNGDDPKLKSGPKGINTAESSDDILNLKEIPGLNYRQYKDPQSQQAASLATIATTPAKTAFIGNTLIDKKTYNKLAYVPVDLARAIPDKTEREAFIADSGSKLVKLASPEQYGVVFDHQLGDASKFAEANYHKEFKKFLDELKDSQNWAEKFAANAVKLVGRTATGVTGILPVVWGLGKALLTLDSKAILNNSVMDAWEAADAAIDKQTVVYGGYDYYFNPDGSPKDEDVFGKFAINPMKAFNETVAPAVGFVASAIISELAWTAATATTFGGAVAGLTANTARIMAQGTRLFGGAARAVMPKSILALRGLDQLSDLQKAAQLADLTNKYRAGIGMATSMVRSAGYESALIGRDTQRSAYDEMIKAHVENTGEQPTAQEEEYYAEKANDQGLLAFSLNVPLVGVSNMLQFTKAFASGYKISQTAARLNPLNLAGTTVGKAGNLVAKADKVGRLGRFAGYSTAMLADGITEGAEEFLQGALQYGLADYAAANYSKGAVKDSVGYLAAITNAARNFAGTTEGFDSIAIGGLMGMVGLRLPIKLDTDTGKYKFSLKGTAFGGALSKYRDVSQDIKKARDTAKAVNDAPVNQNLKDNFANMARNFNTQQEMDDAVARGDVFTYKNLEHKDFHSYVSTRYNAGLVDTIYQEIEAARKIPLDVFNKQYAPSGVVEFTEETRKKALDQFEKATKQVEKAHKEVELVFNDKRHFVDFFNKNYLGVRDPFGVLEGVKDQLTYLHSFESNLSSREKDLQDKVRDLSAGNVDPSVIDEIIAEVSTKPNSKEKNADIKTTARETYRAALAEWKSRDPKGYNKYVEEVKPLLKDLIEIKSKGIQTSELYRFLSTKQGADKFAIFYDNLLNQAREQAKKEAERVAAEELKKAKSTEKTKKAAADEFSATGSTKNFDAKVDEELEEANRATREALQGVPGAEAFTDSEAIEAIDSDYVVRTLENSPALFAEITERLSAKGTPLPISSIDQLDDALASDPMLTVKIAAELAALAKENSSKKEYTKEKPTFADPEDASQPSPSSDDLEVGDRSKYVEEAKVLSDLFQVGQSVSDQAIIPILYDKELERNKNTGRFEEKGKDPIDRKKVNSAEFLNNKDLLENVREAELRVMDNDYNKGNVTADDVAIGVYYGDTFLGLLPGTNPNSPANFKALREAVYKNYLGEAIEEETTADNKAKIADIERRRKEVDNWQLPKKVDPKKQVFVQPRLVAEGNEQKIIDILNDILDAAFTDSTYRNSINRLSGVQSVKDTSKMYDDERAIFLKTIKDRYYDLLNQELAALEGTQTVSPATTEKIEALSKELTTLENTLTDLESELEAAEQELNSPDSKQNQSIDKIIEEDVTEEELNAVIAEENLADQQEAKEKIKEEVKTQLNNKGKITPKTTLQKIASRIKKAVLKVLIVATLLNGSSFTFSPSAKAKDYQNASIENLKSFEDVKLAQDELNKLDNINTITEFNKDKTGKYLIVDKNAAMAHLFDGDSLVASYEVGTGKEKGDEQTKTIVKNGKVYWEEGNKQTGAGIYDINSVGKYKSSAAYTLKNEQGLEVSTVLHETLSNRKKLFKDNNPSNNRMSFGCVNFQAQSLQDLSKNHKDFAAGSKVYILPDNPLNEFKVEDGKLVFKSTDAKVNRSKKDYKFEPITMKANTSSDASKVVLQTLADSKQKLMGLYPTVSNDIYNQIAKLAYGIFGQESSFGSYGGPRGQIGRVTDFAQLASNYVFNSNYNPSVGITQLRYSNIREELKQIFKINSANDLLDNEKATQATMGLLLDIYVNEIPDNKKEDFEKLIPLAYSNRTEYTKALKDPKAYKNAYVENVINNAKEAKVYLGVNESGTKPIKTKSSQKGNILFGFGLLALVRRRKNNEEVSDEEIESAKSKTVKELDRIKSRLKEITQELQKLKNPSTRESVINENFNNIINQLAKSGYNIFFNEDKIFKKC